MARIQALQSSLSLRPSAVNVALATLSFRIFADCSPCNAGALGNRTGNKKTILAIAIQQSSIRPGDKVAYCGDGMSAFWAALDRVSIVAEVPIHYWWDKTITNQCKTVLAVSRTRKGRYRGCTGENRRRSGPCFKAAYGCSEWAANRPHRPICEIPALIGKSGFDRVWPSRRVMLS